MASQRKAGKAACEKLEGILKPSFRIREKKVRGRHVTWIEVGTEEPRRAEAEGSSATTEAQGAGSSTVHDETRPESAEKKSPYADAHTLPYVELFLPDGRLVWQCQASFTCPKRFAFESRRDRMVEHLKSHGLDVDIPSRKGGRPKEETRNLGGILPNPDKVASQKQSKKRFYEGERKERVNVKKQGRLRARGKNLWHASGHKADELTEDEFIAEYVKHGMEKYMANKADRLRRIHETIKEGYDAHKRGRKVPDWAEVFMSEFDEEDLDEDADVGQSHDVDAGQPHVVHDDVDAGKSHVVEDEPPADPASTEVDEKLPQSMDDLNIGDDTEEFKVKKRKKLPIKRQHKGSVTSPIQVSSPLDHGEDDANQYTFLISNGNVSLAFTKGDVIAEEAKDLARLQSGSRILFSSSSSGLVVEIDFDMLDAILKTEASTKTMNAFGLWMEHMLAYDVASKVCVVESLWFDMMHNVRGKSRMAKCLDGLFTGMDVSSLVFVFFFILLRGHWSLFVLYMN